jgi:hypothetical protein
MADDDTGVLATIETVAPEGWRKHVAAVMFQLGLGTRRTADLYAKGRDAVDLADGRALVNKALAQAVASQAIADPELMERAKARFLGEAFAKQENLEAVLQGAEQQLLLAPPEGAGQSDNADSNSSSYDAGLDKDWAAAFTREAELASSDELRSRLAKVLSGEIAQPGTFARSTIRLIAELDRHVLEDFQKLSPYIASNGIITTEDWNSGEYFSAGMRLDDAGLINGVTGSTHKRYTISPEGYATLISDGLALVFHGNPGTEKRISCWLLSTTGVEVARLLPAVSRRPALLRAADEVDKSDLTLIELGAVVETTRGLMISADYKVWQKSVDGEPAL